MQKKKGFFQKYWVTILIIIATIGLYYFATRSQILDPYLFPRIDRIAASFQQYLPTMFINMLASFQLLFPAIILSLIVAILVGVPLGLNISMREALHPIIYSLSVIPSILLSPFAIHLAPTFRAAAFFLIFYNTLWATLFSVINGISTINRGYLDNAATLEVTGSKRLWKVIIPASMPSITSGITTSIRSSFVILSYAEMLGSDYGMGYFIQHQANLGQFTHVWSGFVFMVIILVLIMLIWERFKSYLLRWTD